MYINVSVAAGLYFLRRHEKFLIKLLVELIKNQAAFCGNKGTVRVRIFLVSDIHDGLALVIYVIQHSDKILLIITVIPVALCDDRLDFLQSTLHNIMHDRNRNFIGIQFVDALNDLCANIFLFLLRKLRQCAIS